MTSTRQAIAKTALQYVDLNGSCHTSGTEASFSTHDIGKDVTFENCKSYYVDELTTNSTVYNTIVGGK